MQQQTAQEESESLHGVLAAGEPRDPLEQLPFTLALGRRLRDLDRGFAGRLGQILGHAANPLRDHHPRNGHGGTPGRIHEGQHQEAGDLSDQADRQHAGNAKARREPSTDQVRQDAGGLIQQEQEREYKRGEAEFVEVHQHQHAQRAVGQREPPIG